MRGADLSLCEGVACETMKVKVVCLMTFVMASCKFLSLCGALLLSNALVGLLPQHASAANAVSTDNKLDCAINELAFEYAKKLQPWQGDFKTVYDALQLSLCNVSLTSGGIKTDSTAYHKRLSVKTDSKVYDIVVYVDTHNGDDKNPGTLEEPVQTLQKGVELYRFQKTQLKDSGIVYLMKGTYYLTETINLGIEDSYLTISGFGDEKPVISGGKRYHLLGLWKEIVNNISAIKTGISAINGTATIPGTSNHFAKFYGKTDNPYSCEIVCVKDPSCFAFTWHDSTKGSFANMCYFRIDGLWLPTKDAGTYSGKKLKIVVANLTDQDPIPFTSLFIDGRRAVRARYPDGNPETMGLHTTPTGYVSSAVKWLPPYSTANATDVLIESPQRNGTHFPMFQIGVGGPVSLFTPPESYWGGTKRVHGATYTVASGLQYSPNEWFANNTWEKPGTGIVHAFQCHYWGNWQFRISDRDNDKQQIRWHYGGFQEARGCETGREWYVENIFEELSSPGEWFYDETDNLLYLYPNDTAPAEGIGTVLEQLITIRGTIDNPVENISLVNLTFAHTEPTFLNTYEVPSGGDWSIHRGGAVFVEGVEQFTLSNCLFDSPGGNGVFLSNYIRNTIIEYNEFKFTGDSAIAVVGSTNLIDGTDGNQPMGTDIHHNLMHEIGIFGKQTSAFVQALACRTSFTQNVLFNGPRAAININDGFGGFNFFSQNLGFNWVRETQDHGVFNSWDRQPYLTTVRDESGSPSLTPAESYIMNNFFISNYNSYYPIDHDDGSCYYTDTYNFLVYGGYKNHLGHSKTVQNNIYVYPDVDGKPFCAVHTGASTDILPSGWDEKWTNNTCIIGNPNIYYFKTCNPSGDDTGLIPFTANNTFYAPNKDVYIQCRDKKLSLAEFQEMGYDVGSKVLDPVDYNTIVDWGRKLLQI